MLPQKLNATHFAKIFLSDLDRFAGVVAGFDVARESVNGTFETCRRTLRMSVDPGKPEVTSRRSKRRF